MQYVSEWVWLCASKLYLQKLELVVGWIWPVGYNLQGACFKSQFPWFLHIYNVGTGMHGAPVCTQNYDDS